MDSLSSTIASLRSVLASAAAYAAQIDALAGEQPAAAAAAPLVFPEVPTHPPGTAAGAGLPPTEGGRNIEWYTEQLPMPAPIQAQQTLGIATAATFGDSKVNAEHYLLGKSLYECPKHLLEAKDAANAAWHISWAAVNNAPYGCKGLARRLTNVTLRKLNTACKAVTTAKALVQRFQDYYDGAWLSTPAFNAAGEWVGSKPHFIYRFYVFEELNGAAGVYEATWKPIGLLNPHTYIGSKVLGERKTFLDFVDASQPAPDVMAYWCTEFGVVEEVSAPPALPPTLSRQNAVCCGAGGGGVTYEETLSDLMDDKQYSHRFRELHNGTWTTLSDGRRAMVYRFYAYDPPADGSFRTAQPLTCLGLYNPDSRTVDSTKNTIRMRLPNEQADWPW